MSWRCVPFLAVAVILATRSAYAVPSIPSDEQMFDRLLSWMQTGIDAHVNAEHHSGLPRLNEVIGRKDRTFVAKRDLHDGELLMRFPRERLMHAGYFLGRNASFAAMLAKALENKIVYMAPQTWLALYMMEQQHLGEESEWYPYLSLLPSSFKGNPVFYGDEEFDWLKGSTFVPRAKKHLEGLTEQFNTVAKLVPAFANNFTLEEFLWARSAIATRCFGWDLPGIKIEQGSPDGTSDFMVPVGDMFNHRSPKQLEWLYNATTDTLDYWVRENVVAGGELLISYGTKSNGEYLLHYGFAVAGLPQRGYPVCSVRVALGLENVPDQEAKRKWLIKASFSPVKDHEPVDITLRDTWEKEPEKMLAHARLLELADMKEVERQILPGMKNCKRISQPPLCPKPLSIPNERAALKRCLAVIQESLRLYPTTLEEDEALLPTLEGLPVSLVTLRRDEKIVLRWWEKFLVLGLEVLDGLPVGQIEKRCKEVLGDDRCDEERNYYMNVTLHEFLAGEPVPEAEGGIISSPALWVTLGLIGAIAIYMKQQAATSPTTAKGRKEARKKGR